MHDLRNVYSNKNSKADHTTKNGACLIWTSSGREKADREFSTSWLPKLCFDYMFDSFLQNVLYNFNTSVYVLYFCIL